MSGPLAVALLPALALALVAWLASLVRRDASLVDRFWSWMVLAPALQLALAQGWPGAATPAGAMLLLGLAWALRLSVYVSWRNWGHGEDRRYAAIRARNEPGFALKSVVLVFALQAVLAWIVALPLLAGLLLDVPAPRWPLHALAGAALGLAGLVIESVADAQLARFKADPAQAGRVMDRGLWRYSRHPNYFGECCVWWGFWLMAPLPWWTLASPLLMTVLLLRVSGVSLLEQDIAERRPGYRRYVQTTPAFFPGLPKKAPQ